MWRSVTRRGSILNKWKNNSRFFCENTKEGNEYRTKFNSLAGQRNIEELERVFQEMINNNIKNTHSFNVLLTQYQISNSPKLTSFYDSLKTFGITPDRLTYAIMLKYFVGMKNDTEIENISQKLMKVPPSTTEKDKRTYTVIMESLIEANRLDLCLKIFQESLERNIKPDQVTITVLISALCKADKFDSALDMFNTLLKKYRTKLDSTLLNCVIDGCYKADNEKEANKIFKLMKRNNIPFTVYTYSSIIDYLASKEKLYDAIDQIRIMRENNIQPNTVTYNILFKHIRIRNLTLALQLYNQMKCENIHPDAVSILLLGSYCNTDYNRLHLSSFIEVLKNDAIQYDLMDDSKLKALFAEPQLQKE